MVAPKPKQPAGISAVYSNTTKAIASTFQVVSNVAEAGEYLSQNTIISAKKGLLETYKDLLQDFGIDTTQLTPIEVRAQAEAILDF